jgi:hypothetical protein
MSLKSSDQQSSDDNDDDDILYSKNKEITDADIEELENLLPYKKPPPTRLELRIFEAAQAILKDSCGIISMMSLTSKIKIDAANLLVDDYLLISTSDLFQNIDDIDPEGYVKYVPDEMDLMFCGRLAHYNITYETYLNSAIIPDLWKARLSVHGIQFLCNMAFYRKLLNLPLHQSSSNTQVMDHDYDKQEKQISLITHDEGMCFSSVPPTC